MSKFRRKRISFIARLRNYFITGIVVLVPIGITLYLTTFFISISLKNIYYFSFLSFLTRFIPTPETDSRDFSSAAITAFVVLNPAS